MLEVQGLCCARGSRILFKNLSFSVQAGERVIIGGENGSGKTSLLRILAGLAPAEKGQVMWQGIPVHRSRRQYHRSLLYLGHQTGIKSVLTVYENLAFYQSVFALPQPERLWQVLAQVGLAGYEDVIVAQLSAGQQRRVALARLWLSQQPLWILDEPFTAIDKQGIEKLIKLFEQHAAQGGSVVLTTHQDISDPYGQFRRISLNAEVTA